MIEQEQTQFSAQLPEIATMYALDNFEVAANFMKALSHEGRLIILCHLVNGAKSVTELSELLNWRQSSVSQQLKILKLTGLVVSDRNGKNIFYSIGDPKVKKTIDLLYGMYCVGTTAALVEHV